MTSVLILGAGASRRAGYPTARELLSRIRDEALQFRACQFRNAWNSWETFLRTLPPELEVVCHSSNPEIVLSLPDLFAAAAEFEDENQIRKAGREILSEARAAIAQLLECLDCYFSFHHHDDSQKPANERDYLRRHLSSLIRGDAIITFNWDTLVERTLAEDGRWCPVDGYGFARELVQELPSGIQQPVSAAGPSDVVVLKLHGSYGWRCLHDRFFVDGHEYLADFTFPLLNAPVPLRDAAEPRNYSPSDLVLVYPSFFKHLARPVLTEIWTLASAHLWRASFVEVIGYSLPTSDSAARALLLPLVQRLQSGAVRVVIQDQSPRTLARWKAFLGPKVELRQEAL